MRGKGRAITLADVRVGFSAVLAPNPVLDASQTQRLVELGLRPGTTVRVMMRTAGGGRVLGVDNLRIVLDRYTLRAIPVRSGHSDAPPEDAAPLPDPPSAPDVHPPGGQDTGRQSAAGQDTGRVARSGRPGTHAGTDRRPLRLLKRPTRLTMLPGNPLMPPGNPLVLPGNPLGDGTG